jgi:hypothetical protein
VSRRFLFVGEKPSETAFRRGLTWEDGSLAAKTLFDALDAAGIDRTDCAFVNLYGDHPQATVGHISLEAAGRLRVIASVAKIVTVVAMGRQVENRLRVASVPHLYIVHPAARGAIREKTVYQQHVADVLKAGEPQ